MGFLNLCGKAGSELRLGVSGLRDKKATIPHACSACGKVDEVEVSVAANGINELNFDEGPGSTEFKKLCMWK